MPPAVKRELDSVIELMRWHGDQSEWSLRNQAQADTWWSFVRVTGIAYRLSPKEILERMERKAEFVDVPLNANHKKKIKEYADKGDWLADTLEELSKKGYRISLGPDVKNKCFMSTVSSVTEKKNKDKIITSRAKAPIKAITATMYKVAVIKKWGVWAVTDIDDDDWME